MSKKKNKTNKKCLLAVLIVLIVIALVVFFIKKANNDTESTSYATQKNSEVVGAQTSSYNTTTTETDNTDSFTVQFYAYVNSIVTENSGDYVDLSIIETHTDSGAVLPTNNGSSSSNYNLSTIELKKVEGTENEYEVVLEEVLTQIYLDESYSYVSDLTIDSINKLKNNKNYTVKEIWILNENGDPESDDTSNDWTVVEYSENITFTNNKEYADDENTIYVDNESTLRLVYETVSDQEKVIDANFYDYNITDGNVYSSNSLSSDPWTSGTKYYYTYKSGINSAENYSGSGTMLAFGNNNTATGLGTLIWKDSNNVSNTLNKYNNSSYKGVTFGLVGSLDEDGNITYSDGVISPNLYNDGYAIGKETFSNAKLNFIQSGDTYILTSINSESNNINISGLDTFIGRNQYVDGKSFGATIYSNDFWPLDDVEDYDGKDPLMGDYYEHLNGTMKYFGGSTGSLPVSDDSENHNYYFGMHLSIEFTITEDYVGPLEYLFYGDDDVWVFVDNELVVDIGGVHTSIGEHVDLWDYIEKGTEGTHTLDIYYNERGGSGSTCYMYYALPSVSSTTTSSETGKLKVLKTVKGDDISENTEFDFKLSLTYDGTDLTDIYSYSIYDDSEILMDTGTISNNGTFSLKDGEYIIINNLPVGTECEIEELSTGYITSYKVNESEEVTGLCSEGTITSENEIVTIEYINELKTTDITVTKTWVDNDNKELTRPSSVTINLLQDGEIIKTKEITAEDNWEYTFKDLEKYDSDDGHAYEYTITEEEVSNYKTEIDGYNITNTYIGSDAEITNEITKTANIGILKNGVQTITYNISYDVSINNYIGKAIVTIVDYLPYEIDKDTAELDDGTYSAESKTITWTEEVEVTEEGYTNTFEKEITVSYKDIDVSENIENTVVGSVTTYYPDSHPDYPGEQRITAEDEDTETVEYIVSVEVRKVWDDNDDVKEHRPESVTVSLLADGEIAYDYDGNEVSSAELTEENDWQYTFENLPKYDSDGNKIEYTVEESETTPGDLEYYEDAEITYGNEYVEIKNTYQTKKTDLKAEILKTGTEKITSVNEEVTYTIEYTAKITEYIGDATLTVVDTLPYEIVEEKSDLSEGVYDSNINTITWKIDLGHINTDENGDYEVTFEKTITVVYGENLDVSVESFINTVGAKVYLLETDTTNEVIAEAKTEADISAKVIVKYVELDTGEELIDGYEIDGKPGDEYETIKEAIDGYTYVKNTNNTTGDMTEDTIEVIYYYIKTPAKVHVTYVDIDTGEEIEDDELTSGYVNDEYTTEQKNIEYYEYVMSTDNTEGTMEEETIEVIYYYRKLEFNMAIDKTVSSITKNGTTTSYNSDSVKAEVGRNEVSSTTITVEYKITVTNTGKVSGTGTVTDYIPDYFTISSSNPSYWTADSDGNLRTTVNLEAGESTELTVVLDWTQGENNFGTTTNTAKIVDTTNPANYAETSTDDNEDSAKVVLSVRTGWDVVNEVSPYVILGLCGMALIIMGIKKNRKQQI